MFILIELDVIISIFFFLAVKIKVEWTVMQ